MIIKTDVSNINTFSPSGQVLKPESEVHDWGPDTEGNENIYVRCSCGSEIVQLQRDKETKEIYMALYSYGHAPNNSTLKDRLKLIWRIIRRGTPYVDSICLDKKEQQMIVDFLQKG
jgi:hypothetical protein